MENANFHFGAEYRNAREKLIYCLNDMHNNKQQSPEFLLLGRALVCYSLIIFPWIHYYN